MKTTREVLSITYLLHCRKNCPNHSKNHVFCEHHNQDHPHLRCPLITPHQTIFYPDYKGTEGPSTLVDLARLQYVSMTTFYFRNPGLIYSITRGARTNGYTHCIPLMDDCIETTVHSRKRAPIPPVRVCSGTACLWVRATSFWVEGLRYHYESLECRTSA